MTTKEVDATVETVLDAEVNLPDMDSSNRGFMPLWSSVMHSMHIEPGWNQESDPIVEIDETVFKNTDTTNRPPPEFHLPLRHDLTRLDSNELRVCNFHINSKMLHKENGGYDLVRSDFTSVAYAALASEVDILAGDGNLAAQRNFTGQTDADFTTSLCTEVVEAVLTAVNNLRELEYRISYNQHPCRRMVSVR